MSVTQAEMDRIGEAMKKARADVPHIKHDEGKLRYTLVPPKALASVVSVLTHGAQKYADDNWKKAFREGERGEDCYIDAAFRHIQAHREGCRDDSETKEPHLASAIASLLFVLGSLVGDVDKNQGEKG